MENTEANLAQPLQQLCDSTLAVPALAQLLELLASAGHAPNGPCSDGPCENREHHRLWWDISKPTNPLEERDNHRHQRSDGRFTDLSINESSDFFV
jgi:hypothetical protein